MDAAIDHAKKGDLEFFKDAPPDILMNARDSNGETVLSIVVNGNHVDCCEEICQRCPLLIYHQSKSGRTALHHAAWRGEPEMLKFLIGAGAKSYNEYAEDDIENGGGEKIPPKMLLTMIDDQGDTALHKAVLNHKLEAVKLLLEVDPDYEYSANTSGNTPIMISVREARSKENKFDSGGIRRLLFEMQPRQIMAWRGENSWTLLHKATSEEDLSCIEDIIEFCPGHLHLEDNEGKNFLHIAAEFGKVEVVKKVLRVKDIPPAVLNHQDNDGNTPFHIAALTGNEDLTRCFLFDCRVDKNTWNNKHQWNNNHGQKALNEINFIYDKRKAGVFGIDYNTEQQSYFVDKSDYDLVVGALITTVSFTAGITVPGGYTSDGADVGTAVFSKKVSFATFIISNSFALVFSLYAIFSIFLTRRLREEADIISQLTAATHYTSVALCCMMAAFIAGSFVVLANSNWLPIVVCIIGCLFFILATNPLWKLVRQSMRAAPVRQHKRWKCFGLGS